MQNNFGAGESKRPQPCKGHGLWWSIDKSCNPYWMKSSMSVMTVLMFDGPISHSQQASAVVTSSKDFKTFVSPFSISATTSPVVGFGKSTMCAMESEPLAYRSRPPDTIVAAISFIYPRFCDY